MNTSLLIICSDEKNDVSSPQSRYLKKKKITVKVCNITYHYQASSL